MFLLALEVILLVTLARRLGIGSPYFIVFVTSFIYLNAVYLDYLLFDIHAYLNIIIPIYPDFESDVFFKFNLLSFSYLLTFFIAANYYHNFEQIKLQIHKANTGLNFNFKLFFLVLIAFNLYSIFRGWEMTRVDRVDLVTPYNLWLRNITNYFFILLFCFKNQRNPIILIFYATTLLYFFVSFEREPIVVVLLCILYKNNLTKHPLVIILMSILLFIVLSVWKFFYVTVLYPDGGGIYEFVNNFQSQPFTLAGLDPKTSFLLSYNFIEDPNIYADYKFSYISGIYHQFYRIFLYSDYETLAEYSTRIFTGGNYGTAFSFLIESILNLGYFGPIIVAIVLNFCLFNSFQWSKEFGVGIVVITVFLAMKLMRTELSTLVKLQLLPVIFSCLLFRIYNKTNSVINDS